MLQICNWLFWRFYKFYISTLFLFFSLNISIKHTSSASIGYPEVQVYTTSLFSLPFCLNIFFKFYANALEDNLCEDRSSSDGLRMN